MPPEQDPLATPGFDAVECLNALFPSEQSLWNLETVTQNLNQAILRTDNEIEAVMRSQVDTEERGAREVDQTKLAIQALYDRISEMKQRAELSEGAVLNITQDIKSLDNAKRNLVAAVTLLKRLQMLTIATEQLQSICESRRYKEASHLLLAVQELQGFFEEYHQLPDVIQLSSKIEVLKKT
ncbi:Vacuolar protein sorting-associated protein 53, partial [Dimargaris verticillata]